MLVKSIGKMAGESKIYSLKKLEFKDLKCKGYRWITRKAGDVRYVRDLGDLRS